jgi:hypothetical protein
VADPTAATDRGAPLAYVLDETGALVVAESRGIEPNELGYRFDRALGMLDSSRLGHLRESSGFLTRMGEHPYRLGRWWGERTCAALIGAIASVIRSALTYLAGIRSLPRSVNTSNRAPLGRLLETRLGGLEHYLKRLEGSLSEVRELLAYERRRSASPLWSPISRPPELVWSPKGR